MVIERARLARRDVSVRIETMPPENRSNFFCPIGTGDDSPRGTGSSEYHRWYRNSGHDIRKHATSFPRFRLVADDSPQVASFPKFIKDESVIYAQVSLGETMLGVIDLLEQVCCWVRKSMCSVKLYCFAKYI